MKSRLSSWECARLATSIRAAPIVVLALRLSVMANVPIVGDQRPLAAEQPEIRVISSLGKFLLHDGIEHDCGSRRIRPPPVEFISASKPNTQTSNWYPGPRPPTMSSTPLESTSSQINTPTHKLQTGILAQGLLHETETAVMPAQVDEVIANADGGVGGVSKGQGHRKGSSYGQGRSFAFALLLATAKFSMVASTSKARRRSSSYSSSS